MANVQGLFGEAIQHHQAGRLAEADALYRRVLAEDRNHVDALHLLGVLAHQCGRHDIAVDLIGQAIRLNDQVAAFHSNLGAALKDLGRLDEALASYGAALRLQADFADALYNRGVVLQALGHRDDAIASYNAVIRAKPDYAEALYNRGVLLKEAGRLDDALASYDAALRIRPNYAKALSNRGTLLSDLGWFGPAIECYEAALRIWPDFADALYNRVLALNCLERFDDAFAACQAALCSVPGSSALLFVRGNTLKELGRVGDAAADYRRALRVTPDHVDALCNLGAALTDLGLLEEAVASYDKALCVRPESAEAFCYRGMALNGLGRFDAAITSYRTALKIRPDYAEPRYYSAFPHLLRGEFGEGLEQYEWRWRCGSALAKLQNLVESRWQGEDLAGRTILLHAEQGLGDTIQFCRYARLAAERGARVVLAAPKKLRRLLSCLDDVDQLAALDDDRLPTFDLHCPLLSLPRAFATTIDSIPAHNPYLFAEPERIAYWRDRLGEGGGKIGIVWRGGTVYQGDKQRSVALSHFAPLAARPGVRLISLQKQHGVEQLRDLPAGMTVETLGDEFDSGPDAFIDTAAVMANLDLVVTVDTSICHLAGALGRPVWIALQHIPHWVWGLDRKDSPWYPSARLFRQSQPGDWDGVFEKMAAALPI